MRRILSITAIAALSLTLGVAQQKRQLTPQAQRGRELFQKSPKGTACATCHFMDGVGTAIGPNLTRLASLGTPHVMVATIKMQMTNEVMLVKTATEKFPGRIKSQEGDKVEVWDLSKTPPVLRTFNSKEVTSMDRDTEWHHPPALTDYSSQELADIIGFLRWTATGSQKEIKASEVEE
jgi:mono/diheme cytochrome c family protein